MTTITPTAAIDAVRAARPVQGDHGTGAWWDHAALTVLGHCADASPTDILRALGMVASNYASLRLALNRLRVSGYALADGDAWGARRPRWRITDRGREALG